MKFYFLDKNGRLDISNPVENIWQGKKNPDGTISVVVDKNGNTASPFNTSESLKTQKFLTLFDVEEAVIIP